MTTHHSLAFRSYGFARFKVSRTAFHLALVAGLAMCIPAMGYAATDMTPKEDAGNEDLIGDGGGKIQIGYFSNADEVSIAKGDRTARRLSGVADGRMAEDAVNLRQLTHAGLIGGNGEILRAVTFNAAGTEADLRNAQLKNVADGTEDTDAVNLRQLKANGLIAESGSLNAVLYNQDQSVVTLMGAQGSLLTGVRDGRIELGSRDAINGSQLAYIRDDLQNQIDRVDNRIDNLPVPVAPDAPINGVDSNQGKVINDDTLAEANAYTDNKASQSNTYTDTQVNAARDYADQQAVAATATANRYTDQRIEALNQTIDQFRSDVNQRFQRQDVRMDRMGAMSAATAQMVMSSSGLQTKNHVGVGIGVQNGRSALAVGYSRAISPSMRVSLGGSASGGEVSAGAGVGIGW